MTGLRVFAVDDEPLALRRLSSTLAALPGVSLIGSDTSARSSISRIRQLRPDVLLLDIAMPGLDGFELIQQLEKDTPPAVIFITAFDQHAVSAFEKSALDYLLKPVSSERLSVALSRARSAIEARNNGRRLQELMEVISSYRSASRIGTPESKPVLWASRGRALVKMAVSELWWIQAEGDYVRLYSEQGEGLARETLSRLADHLDPAVFLRVHRSVIVRKSQVRRVRRKATGAIVAELVCGTEVPVGRKYARGIGDFLRKLPGQS